MAEEAIVTAGDLGGDAAGVLDPGKLAWAVRVVMTHRRIHAKQVSIEAGLLPARLTDLLRYGKAPPGVQLSLLAWLDPDSAPAYLRPDPVLAEPKRAGPAAA